MLNDDAYKVIKRQNGDFKLEEVPALDVINERLRDDYIVDCQRGVDRWNKIIADNDIDFTLKLPHRAFHRAIGDFADMPVSPEGQVISQEEYDTSIKNWLPSDKDEEYVGSLMTQVTEPGKFANWIAPPRVGINNQPIDFEYVKLL